MGVDRQAALAAVRERLSAESAAHSERVAVMAKRIAEAYALDAEEAYLGGLLHDWARDMSGEDLLREARLLGLPVTEVDERVPYLLHAPVGARLLRREFPGLSEAVLESIATHTCGAPRMSELAMAVFVADSIEPGRTHASASVLRAAVGALPLRELFVRTYADGLRHLVETRRPMHPQTLKTWNWIADGGATS
ncbi:MAG: bis(5'-nucleosyl)-tetraphosphatase (symmetrical) YqeK [Anaerosomatales bacterium]|nr:bis(5'-nucleosyl)-tetraphosphatase (symmetrical) YqeK [Coriobacteriia bacterium]MDI6692846.1 bis(5'-nucleosyl)-tetraphosphatase (symmetrical) YqeK [Anaerosomatales bacterium]